MIGVQAPPINAPFLDGKIVSNIWMMWLKSLVEYVNDTNAIAFNTNTQMITTPVITSSVVVDAEMDPSMVAALIPFPVQTTAEDNTNTHIYPMINTTQSSTTDDYLTLHWMEA